MSVPKFIRGNFTDFFSDSMLPLLEEVFFSELQRHPSVREEVFNMVPWDRDIWQYSEVHDMSLFSSVDEGADYSFDSPKQGYDKTLTIVKYGLGFSITEEAVEDQKYNFIMDGVKKLAKSAKETQEQAAMDIFNNGFSTETCADGVAVFSTSHTTPTGTYSIANRPSTDVDLSFTSLSNALSAFKKYYRGDSGIYYRMMPKYLLVPTELELYANQLVKSSLEADSANNNINPFQNGLQVISSPHLTDSDAWFLISDKVDHTLDVIVRKAIETKAAASDSVGFLNDAVLYKTRYREKIGVMNACGIYGTTGAA